MANQEGSEGNYQNVMIPYSRHSIGEDDIQAVVDILRSDWLTTGPLVEIFEQRLSGFVGASYGVAVSSGTAGLNCATYAIDLKPGDEVIVSPMTFAATANCIVHQGAIPVFADVEPQTLLIDPDDIKTKISDRTRAVIAVDYAGHPADYDAIRAITSSCGIHLISDACHALGARYKEQPVGCLADLSVFSFHPVKQITTGEGGMVTTNNAEFARRMRLFRNHGIISDHRQREKENSWYYEIVDIGHNYRLTDIQCALGITQLQKLNGFLKQRHEIARRYNKAFARVPEISPLDLRSNVYHGYHLYVVKIDFKNLGISRESVFKKLRQNDIGVNVQYIPVHLHPFYRKEFQTGPGLCPVAEEAYEQILSIPIFQGISRQEQEYIINHIVDAIEH